jgi:hypothetical protein
MSKKAPKVKSDVEEPEWVPPPYPKPAIEEFVWREKVEAICQGWVDVEPAEIREKVRKLQEMLDATPADELYTRHFYLQDKHWVEWTTSKHQVLNSNIHMLSLRASRLELGIGK